MLLVDQAGDTLGKLAVYGQELQVWEIRHNGVHSHIVPDYSYIARCQSLGEALSLGTGDCQGTPRRLYVCVYPPWGTLKGRREKLQRDGSHSC